MLDPNLANTAYAIHQQVPETGDLSTDYGSVLFAVSRPIRPSLTAVVSRSVQTGLLSDPMKTTYERQCLDDRQSCVSVQRMSCVGTNQHARCRCSENRPVHTSICRIRFTGKVRLAHDHLLQ